MAADNGHSNDGWDERTKPSFLRRVRIRGYKSIAFCDVELKPLTILVGRNAAGKSNFLDALAFLCDAVRFDVSEAVRRRGGIFHQTTDVDSLSIEVELGFPDHAGTADWQASYCLNVSSSQRTKPESHQERLVLRKSGSDRHVGFHATRGKAEWFGDDDTIDRAERTTFASDRLLVGVLGRPPFVDLGEALKWMGFYNFHPESIRQLHTPEPGSLLHRDGSNLASVLQSLQEIDPETVQRIGDYLSLIADEVLSFWPVPYGEYETVRFRLRSTDGAMLQFDASAMSDGTLRALAALVAAFQIHLPMGPSVVGIEEPETALHPAAARALVAALDEATGRTQIVLTTHSADLLADRDVHPSQVLVVRNHNGQTQIAPVDPASREIIHKELYTLADLHRQDHLQPDEMDLRRQEALARTNGKG